MYAKSGQGRTTGTLSNRRQPDAKFRKTFIQAGASAELGVSLVTLTDWMKKGLPYMRLHKRVYFKKSEVLNAMQQTIKD